MNARLVSWAMMAVASLAVSAALSGTSVAQRPATRQITPVPFNDDAPVRVAISAGQGELRIGSTTTICFETSKPGYVTLWNIATTGSVARVYPNAHQSAQSRDWTAMKVEGRRACVGTGADPFRFRVDGPPGTEDLYLLWTARPELQPSRASFADTAGLAGEVRRLVEGAATAEWANAKTTYDIVPAEGGAQPAMPPTVQAPTPTPAPAPAPAQAPAPPTPPAAAQQQAGQIRIFSLGANVGQLVKPNQDAAIFTKTTMDMFSVPEANVRFVPNGRKADFKAGMDWLRDTAGPRDLVIIYFSGHGGRVRDPTNTSDDGYDEFLVPYDFEVKKPVSLRDAVFSQELARWVNAIPTDNVIVVVDACHSAGVYRSIESAVLGARSKLYRLSDDADLAREPLPATRAAGGAGRVRAKGLLLAAARRDQSALETSDGSIFTMAMVREMRTARGITLADIFAKSVDISESRSQGRQTPTAVGTLDVARLMSFAP